MYNLSEVTNFYRSFLGRLFIIIVALVFVLASSLVIMRYQNHMVQVDEKIRANSEFIMASSVNHLEAHLSVFQMVEKHIAELTYPLSQADINEVRAETFDNFPSYLNHSLFLLKNENTLKHLHSKQHSDFKTLDSLGIKQAIRHNKLLIGVPYNLENEKNSASTARLYNSPR